MARRTQTHAIRLAVEGGGQVKAELVSVGQSGEQSVNRIETAGRAASGGLKDPGRHAALLDPRWGSPVLLRWSAMPDACVVTGDLSAEANPTSARPWSPQDRWRA